MNARARRMNGPAFISPAFDEARVPIMPTELLGGGWWGQGGKEGEGRGESCHSCFFPLFLLLLLHSVCFFAFAVEAKAVLVLVLILLPLLLLLSFFPFLLLYRLTAIIHGVLIC